MDEGATITVEDDDVTQAVFEDLEGDDGNAEIDYDDNQDEIVINPLTGATFITPEIVTAQGDDEELDGDSAEVIDSTGITCEEAQGSGNGAGRGDRNVNIDDRDQENTCNQVVTIVNEDVQNNDVDNSQDDEAAIDDQEAVDPADPTDGLTVDEVTDEQIVDIAQELNVSPVIVQTCIQQNAGRDANINSNNAEENIDEEFDDEEVVIEEESDDGTVAGDQYGGAGVIEESIPDKLLPNTGGVSPFAVLTALGFALLLAGLSAGYAVARRGS